MSNQEILAKAIEKAIAGGFTQNDMGQEIKTAEDVYYYFDDDHGSLDVNNLIWRHDFARALWGEGLHKVVATYYGKPVGKMSWQYHLQQMVIAEDPIKYLGENI